MTHRIGLYKNPTQSTTFYNLVLGDVVIVYRFNNNRYMTCSWFHTEVIGSNAFNVRLL